MRKFFALILLAAGLTGCSTTEETTYVRAVFMEVTSPPPKEDPEQGQGGAGIERKSLPLYRAQEP